MMFDGMRVIEDLHLVENGEPYAERRSWRTRLFERPWRPWIATRMVVPKIPFRGVLLLDASTLVMHPATWRVLRETFNERR